MNTHLLTLEHHFFFLLHDYCVYFLGVVVNVVAVAAAGWVVAGVLAIAVLVLIIIVLVMLRQRRSGSKDMSDERTGLPW